MKKLLGILILSLFWCNFGTAEVEKVLKEIKKNKDIAQGFNNVKEYDQRNNWRITNKKILKSDKNTRKHILNIVNKNDGFPAALKIDRNVIGLLTHRRERSDEMVYGPEWMPPPV